MRKTKRILNKLLSVGMAALLAVGMLSVVGTDRGTDAVEAASIDAASSVNYRTILGRAVNYGLLAGYIDQSGSHMETTIATKTLKTGQANEIDLCGKEPVWIMVGELASDSGQLDFGQKVHKDIDTDNGEKMTYYLETTQAVYDNTMTTRPNQNIKLISRTQDEINSSVDSMLGEVKNWSDTLAAKDKLDVSTFLTKDSANKSFLTIPDDYAGKTIYINIDDYPDLFNSINVGAGSMLQITKPEDTVIVFNSNASSITISDFQVNGLGTAQDHSGNDSDKNKNIDSQICQKIIWNLPNATDVKLNMSVGLFIVPQAGATVDVINTAAGWIATPGTVKVSSEFHYIYHDRSAGYANQFQFGARKALTKTLSAQKAEADEVSTVSIAEGAYTFELYETDSTYNTSGLTPIKTAKNASNSEFRFDYIEFNSSGVHYYVIKEANQGSVSNNITNSDGEIDIKLDVTKDANDMYNYVVSSEKYVTAADKAAGKSVSTNSDRVANGTLFTFGRFYNKVDVGNLEVTVLDEDTQQPVPNAKVKITDPSGTTKEYTTDTNGKITVKDTLIGDHKIVVTEVPDGYRVTTGEEATKKVEEGKTATHVAEITPTGGLKITVIEEDTKNPVENAVVKVTDPDGNSKEYTTDKNGEILINPTDTGDYDIVVTKVPEGKKVTIGETKTVTVKKLEIVEHVAEINTASTGTLEITVRDEKTNDPVPNADVKVTDPSGNDSNHTTDRTGTITIENTPTGDYTVEVTKVPDGYNVTTGQKVTVTVEEDKKTTETIKVSTTESSKEPTPTTTVTTTNTTSNTSVQTGDMTRPVLALSIMLIALVCLAGIVYLKKKED